MGRVIHFEIPCEDLDRAEQFYVGAFGWECTRAGTEHDYRLVTTGLDTDPGINGALIARPAGSPPPTGGVVMTIGVEHTGNAIQAVRELGGTLLADPVAVPGVGWVAHFLDSEGNAFSTMQDDSAAG